MDTPSELLPVYKSVFQALTEANRDFQKLAASLEALQQISFFPNAKLTDARNVISWLRAELNVALMGAITEREMSNAMYYDWLCFQREREQKSPNKRQIEEEQKKMEQDQPENPE
jgi:hypothetical protein